MVAHSSLFKYIMLLFLGSGPGRGRSPVEWGEILSVRSSVYSSIHPFIPQGLGVQRKGSESLSGGPGGGRTYGRTDVRTNVRTEFLPILQDFVPCRGRCPKKTPDEPKNRQKQRFLATIGPKMTKFHSKHQHH